MVYMFCSVQFSHSVMSNSLWPHESQLTRPPCPITNCQSSLKLMSIESMLPCNHLVLIVPLPSCPQSSQHQGFFPISWLLTSSGQSIGVSASEPVLPMNIQGWFPLGLTGLISWLSKGLSRVFSSTIIWKHPFFGARPSLWSNFHIQMWLLEKP